MEWLYVISAIASSVAAVLAWAAKLWWSREFASAKDEALKAKDAQIALLEREIKQLQEMTPMKLREYFLSVREQLEEYNDKLHAELEEARKEIKKKQNEIELLQSGHIKREDEIEKLNKEKRELERSANELREKLNSIERKIKNKDIAYYWLDIDYNDINNLRSLHDYLRKYLAKTYISDKEIENKYQNYFIPASSLKRMLRSYLETTLTKKHDTEENSNPNDDSKAKK